MNAASALLRSAESLGIILWVDGDQLRYKARQPVSDGMKDRIREHKADIIILLNKPHLKNTTPSSGIGPPPFCSASCERLGVSELKELNPVLTCTLKTDAKHWTWRRVDRLKSCPREKRPCNEGAAA